MHIVYWFSESQLERFFIELGSAETKSMIVILKSFYIKNNVYRSMFWRNVLQCFWAYRWTNFANDTLQTDWSQNTNGREKYLEGAAQLYKFSAENIVSIVKDLCGWRHYNYAFRARWSNITGEINCVQEFNAHPSVFSG